MSLVVNPDFLSLEPFLQRLPECFDREGMTVYKGRNEIKIFEREGLLLNVKSYRKPILLNRIAYTFFRKSKARRAYENALEVMVRGFETPVPVAYLEQRSGGLLEKSWFVSLHCPYTRMLREFADNSDVSGREDILQALGAYVAGLHRSGILHLDLSIGNILFEKDEAGIRFSLVDINRMKFCSIDQELGCRNFERLRGNADFFRVLAHSYAAARGFDPESCLKSILEHSARSVRHFDRKRAIKRFFRPGR